MSNGNGHHYSKFVWQDHLSDEALNACSIASQGMWMRLLAVAHKGTPVGHVTLNGKAPNWAQLAGMLGRPEKEVVKCVTELEANGVCSRTTEGIIFSRRMVKDAEASAEGAKHIAKRWGTKETHPPPNRGATRPPTVRPNGGATAHPITQSLESKKESLSFLNLKGESLSAPVREEPAPSVAAVRAARREFTEERQQYPAPVSQAIGTVSRSWRNFCVEGKGAVDEAELRDNVRQIMARRPWKVLSPEQLAIARRRAGYGPAIQLKVVA